MARTDPMHEEFAALAARPEAEVSLAEGALLIAAAAQPGLDVAHYLRRLDELAADAQPELAAEATDAARLAALSRYLYEAQGFGGNREDYYDPRNSYLNEVLERRVGIPITLAVVFIEVAARLNLAVEGLNFPGHFLLRHPGPRPILIDPFTGQLGDEADWMAQLPESMASALPSPMPAVARKALLARMLRNLKQIHISRQESELALACCERLLLLTPDVPPDLYDRGLLYQELECYPEALRDYERLLELAPDDDAAPAIRERLEAVRAEMGRFS